MAGWESYVDDALAVVRALSPFVPPSAQEAVTIGVKIVQAAIDGEPTAVALYDRITGNGEPVTAAELQQFAADYETSYQKLHADIAAKLAALPPA